MAQFTIYKSTDGSAPVLNGTTGSLINLLDKCLVSGYGSQTAAGWDRAFGTSLDAATVTAYRAQIGNRFYLRVVDNATTTAKEARLFGYETMSDANTGTGTFPTVAQSSFGVISRKSTTADSTARNWIIVADGRTVYAFIQSQGNSAYTGWMFGEFYSVTPSDSYNTMIVGRAAEDTSGDVEYLDRIVADISQSSIIHFVARSYTGTGTSLDVGVHSDYSKTGGNTRFLGSVTYPNPADGGLYLAPIWVHEPSVVAVRGRMRGFWYFVHPVAGIADGNTVSGTGELSGKSFLFIKSTWAGGIYTIETSATLETN